jgi:hypothetical protein
LNTLNVWNEENCFLAAHPVEWWARLKLKITDITGKKSEKNWNGGKQLITGISGSVMPGTPDITVKKNVKDLTFELCCANKVLMKKRKIIMKRRYRSYRWLF